MNAGDGPVRRVLVALDAGPGYQESLRRAAELAGEMDAELAALFIEDANLFRLAGLPTAEISLVSGARHPLEARKLERELRARAAEARADLEKLARARRLTWSFQVWRGRMDDALREATREADLVSLGRETRPLVRGRGRTSRSPAPAPVLVLLEPGESEAGIARLLGIAARMARSTSAPLSIVAAVGGPALGRRLRAVAETLLAELAIAATWRQVRPNRKAVLNALARARPRLLVLDTAGPAVAEGLLDELLHAADAEALLVGGAGG